MSSDTIASSPGDPGSHLIHGFLGPKSKPQIASRSIQSDLWGSLMLPAHTDRLTVRQTKEHVHLRICETGTWHITNRIISYYRPHLMLCMQCCVIIVWCCLAVLVSCREVIAIHVLVPELPFGGVGNSGIGSYHGKFSFDTFSHKRGCLIRAQNLEFANEYVGNLFSFVKNDKLPLILQNGIPSPPVDSI